MERKRHEVKSLSFFLSFCQFSSLNTVSLVGYNQIRPLEPSKFTDCLIVFIGIAVGN